MRFEAITEHRALLGEGPVWDERRQRLFFVDIEGLEIISVAADGSDMLRYAMPDKPCSLGLAESGRLVVALTKRVVLFEPVSGAMVDVAELELDVPTTRLNDGKVGPDGAFWVGSIDQGKPRQPNAALWRVDPTGAVEKKVDGCTGSNGLAWDLAGTTMFHSDSSGACIDRWAFDPATGAISERTRIRADITDAAGRPDGAATDVEGGYWSAGVSAGLLNRYDRDGQLLLSVPVPVAAPSMPCFGGPDLRTLYLTSISHGQSAEKMAAYPATGQLVAAASPVAGVPVARFRDV
jgi:sugar lactone lactonase YvrE